MFHPVRLPNCSGPMYLENDLHKCSSGPVCFSRGKHSHMFGPNCLDSGVCMMKARAPYSRQMQRASENVHHNCVAGDSHLAPLTASLALLKAQQGLRISRHRAESTSKRQTLNVRAETESTKAPKSLPGPPLFTQTPHMATTKLRLI